MGASLVTLGKKSIIASEVISGEDVAKLGDIQESLMLAVDSRPLWRTDVEARVSVLNDLAYPTPAAKFHQACREQIVFFDNLHHLSFAYRRKRLEVEEVEENIASADTDRERARLEIDREEAVYMLSVMQHEGRERVREIVMWEEIKQECRVQDPSINPTDKNADQLLGFTLSYIRKLPAALNSKTDPGASNNIIGQARTGLDACEKAGIDLGREGRVARKLLGKHGEK